MTTRRERAIHEAGHAVAAHLVGKRVELVSIEGTGKLAGFCLFMPADAPAFAPEEIAAATKEMATTMAAAPVRPSYSADEVERRLLIALAGPEAQRMASGGRSSPGDEYDIECARELLGAPHRSAWAVCGDLAGARERTRAFLSENWSDVDALSLALRCSGTLTGDQVRFLLRCEADARAAQAKAAPLVTGENASERTYTTKHRTTPVSLRLRSPRFGPFLTVFA